MTVTDTQKVLSSVGFNRFACQGLAKGTPRTAVSPQNIVRT